MPSQPLRLYQGDREGMEVVSFKLYQRKFIFNDLSAMFYNGRGRERERVGLAGDVWVCGCVCVGGGGGGLEGGGGGEKGGGGDRLTERERFAFTIFCFSTILQVTAVEVKPIC